MTNGKKIAISASIVSLVFSFIFLQFASVYRTYLFDSSQIQLFKDYMINSGSSENEAVQYLHFMQSFVTIILISIYIYLAIGIFTFVLMIRFKEERNRKLGIFLIIIGILHLLELRIVSFILFLLAGLRLKKIE